MKVERVELSLTAEEVEAGQCVWLNGLFMRLLDDPSDDKARFVSLDDGQVVGLDKDDTVRRTDAVVTYFYRP